MLNQELKEELPRSFDNTILSTYCTCPRKLYWFLRGVRAEITPAYFTFGRAWGNAINTWHSLQGKKSLLERKNLAVDAAREIWDKENPFEVRNDNFANLLEMIEMYVENYSQDEPWEVVSPEMGFLLPLGKGKNGDIAYAGALDSEIIWEPYGPLLREDKTYGDYIGKSFLSQWDLSTQVTGYQWAMQEVVGKEIFGVLMNFASKRPRKENGLRFARDLQKRSQEKIKSWVEETLFLIEKIQEEWKSWEWLPLGMRNPRTCAGGPGMSECSYLYLCKDEREFTKLDPSLFQGVIVSEKEWKPWERMGDDGD